MDVWQFWVGRPKSVFALNVLAGARKMQVASNLIIVTLVFAEVRLRAPADF